MSAPATVPESALRRSESEKEEASPRPVNSSFSTINTSLQTSWDSTSLGALKTCPRYYQYSIIEGYASRIESVHLKFGIEFHAALELYDRKRAVGTSHDDALLAALRHAIVSTWDPVLNRPWTSDLPAKNRETLIRSIVWYLDQFADDPLETIILRSGAPAVELSFRFEIDITAPTGENYMLCGHLDKLARWQDRVWIKDVKAQPVTSKVLGVDGWIKIGDLSEGTLIADANGNFVRVKSLHRKGITKVYEVLFNDDTHTKCAEDHLWQISNDGVDNWRVREFDTVKKLVDGHKRFHIPITKSIQHPAKHLVLDPYVLGALLGDGYLGGNSVAISTSNESLIDSIRPRLTDRDHIKKSPANNLVWTITGHGNCHTLNALRELKLWGKLSKDKFIPSIYLFGSETQRRDLLQGLLDTDSSWYQNHLRYQTISHRLAYGVCDLVRSLGGSASVAMDMRGLYKITIRLDSVSKMPPRRKYFKRIKQVEDEETICIEVDSPEGLYITDDYIVTHNTTQSPLNESYFARYSPDNQMSLYDLAGSFTYHDEPIAGLIIDAAQVQVTGTRFQRGIISRTPAQRDEWYQDLAYWLRMAEGFAAAQYWPQNDRSCMQYGGCPYRSVCAVTPDLRPQMLEQLYSRRVWDPLQTREV